MRPKQWFDMRAEDGNYWTVREMKETEYSLTSWMMTTKTWYAIGKLKKAKPMDVRRFGRMTKEEAIAMAKLLNATEGVQHDSE